MTSRSRAAWVAFTLVAVTGGCTSSDVGIDPADAVPSARPGPATPVDVCRLVPAAEVSDLAGVRLSVVDARYLSARLATYRCGFGPSPARPQVTISLAPGPVALAVFDAAYGEQAGGDPTLVEQLGQRAYQRSEADQQSLAVLSHGAILQVAVHPGPVPEVEGGLLRPRALVLLALTAVGRLPENARLGVPGPGLPCTGVPRGSVAAALGRPVALATQLTPADGSVMCSWAGLPGSVTVTVLDSPAEYARSIRAGAGDAGTPVRGVPGGRAWSSPEVPGDLTVLVRPSTVARFEVVPAVGWAQEDVLTTPPEVALAGQAVAALT
ncbi:MAG: hypothetical protein ACRDO2_14545 [Nocardioidaceae bacterium]